jgi:hypothetical protein
MRLGLISFAIAAGLAGSALAKPPVVVEVFTAQGCGECAEAQSLVDSLNGRDGLLTLTFPVDYWDYLGWRDTFAKPEFTARQKSYAQRWETPALVTPQLVIDGRVQAKATDLTDVDGLIRQAQKGAPAAPDIQLSGERVAVGSGAKSGTPADVWLIRYDPRGQEVEIRRGENQGRTLVYRNVVKQLVRLGGWNGKPASFALPEPTQKGLETLILIQAPKGGQVIASLND